MKVVGKKYWIIPDCELPPEGEGVLKGHESVVIVNDSNKKAVIEELKLQEQDKMREIEEFNVKALETMNKSNAVLNTEKKT